MLSFIRLSFSFSNRNVHGLIKIVVKLLQMQVVMVRKSGEQQPLDLYAIRYALSSVIKT